MGQMDSKTDADDARQALTPTMSVGVVVERRNIDNPWVDYNWRAVAVVPGAPSLRPWTVLQAGEGWAQFHAANMDIELFQKETEGYRYNLSSPPPSVYVIMRTGEDVEGDEDVEPFLVTVCPYEAESYVESGDEIVDAVVMPPEILAWVQDFITAFHRDEPFKKRKRKPYDPRKGGSGDQPPPMQRAGGAESKR